MDMSYGDVYSEQLKNLMDEGDLEAEEKKPNRGPIVTAYYMKEPF